MGLFKKLMPDPDPQRFAQFGAPRVQRDASPEIVARFSDEIAELTSLLGQADPMQIAYAPDEYASEARTIVARLATFEGELTLSDVQAIVHDEFVHWFGEGIAGTAAAYDDIAAEVLHFWRESQGC